MKKFLSLVLALVMTMSLVTISAGAKDFTDADTITYDEAVAVMSAVKVIDGYTDDSFKPTATLTRGAAAKIICNLILGPTTAAELPASVAPFKDVPANSTFAGYIAYCAKEGIVGGYADGTFKPGASLTGYAFMKMLLGALGYDAEIEGYNTPGTWSISVAKQALGIGLNAGLVEDFNGVKAVTREEACLYAFNTLKATLVDYDTKTSVNVGDATVVIAGSTAKPVGWNNRNTQTGIGNDGNIKRDEFVQFAEQYFTKLKVQGTRDVFGRPSRTWEYKGEDIGTYVNHDLLVETYTKKVTGKDLYDLLGSTTVEDYKFNIYVDGETQKAVLGSAYFTQDNLVKTNTEKVGATGNGVTTEVYVDSDAKNVTIAIINTYLAKADDDYNEKKENVSFTVWGIDDVTGKKNYVKDTDEKETFKVSNDDINVEDVKEKDIVLVTVAEGEIQSIVAAETLSEVEITKFTKEKSITTEGTEYKYADTAMYDDEVLDKYDQSNMKNTSYNVYLDENGYLIGIEIVEEASKYLFLTGMEGGSSNLNNKNVDANVIFLDGTMDTVTVNYNKSTGVTNTALENTWCTYTVDKNGVYTLTEVKGNGAFDSSKDKVGQSWRNDGAVVGTGTVANTVIDKKHVTLPGDATAVTGFTQVYGNDSSVYITVDTKVIKASTPNANVIIISDVDSVSTGVQATSIQPFTAAAVQGKHTTGNPATPIVNDATKTSYGVYTLFKNNGYVIGAVVVGEDEGNTTNYAYVISDDVNVESYDKATEEWTWTRDVIIDGVVTELTEVGDKLTKIGEDDMDQGKWYEVKFYADGTVRSATARSFNAAGTPGKFISAISDVEASVSGTWNPVILFTDLRSANKTLTVKGNTLQVENKIGYATEGFGVAADAKVVLVQDKLVTGTGKLSKMSYVEEYDNGVKGLEKILNYLNANKSFVGYVSAVFDGGVAKSVVIYDTTATKVDTGSEKVDFENVDLSDPSAVKVYYYGGATKKPSTNAALVAIEDALKVNYDITAKQFDGINTYTFYTKNKTTGFNQTFVFDDSADIVEVFKVKFVYNDATKVTPAEGLVAVGEVVKLTVSNADGSAFTGTYNNATVSKADGTSIGTVDTTGMGQATDDKSFVFEWTAIGLDADQTLTVSMS